jgi:hypothetical protein
MLARNWEPRACHRLFRCRWRSSGPGRPRHQSRNKARRIRVVRDGTVQPTDFLNLAGAFCRVASKGSQGLLAELRRERRYM